MTFYVPKILMDTVLQIRVFRMAGDFSSERSKDDHEQGVRQFSNLQDFKI